MFFQWLPLYRPARAQRNIRVIGRPAPGIRVEHLRASGELRTVVDRERARADRMEGAFCVLVFRIEGPQQKRRQRELLEFLSDRARAYDYVLETPKGDIAWVVLCDLETSRQLASRVARQCSSDEGKIRIRLFWYDGSGEHTFSRRQRDEDRSYDSYGNDSSNIGVRTLPKMNEVEALKDIESERELDVDTLGDDLWMRSASDEPLGQAEEISAPKIPLWKRSMDFTAASIALLLLSPLFLSICLAIKLTSRGPMFFLQQRAGRFGRSFTIYKFRTMVADAEAQKILLFSKNEQDGPAFKMHRDPRVTGIGRILRSTSLDELPQLLNILRGEMSLVGPRPLPLDEAAACLPWQRRRLDVLPGLTCFWQVHHRRVSVPFVDWMRMDLRYIRECSLWLDLRLLAETALFVVRRKGT